LLPAIHALADIYTPIKTVTVRQAKSRDIKKKLSGPILDRIDIQVTVGSVEHKNLLKNNEAQQNPELTKQVNLAWQRQYSRQNVMLNSRLTNRSLKKYTYMDKNCEQLFNKAAEALNLSPRSYMKTLKVARAVADLEDSNNILDCHIAEALQYRPKQITY
jgi:magnesium chelatase family protein